MEGLGAEPLEPGAAAFGALAAEAAADEVVAFGGTAEGFGVDVIEGGGAAEGLVAVPAPVVPVQVDLVTEGAAGDQVGFRDQGPAHAGFSVLATG